MHRMLLMKECENPEEGTRNVVAECLGKLTLMEPATLLPHLQQNLWAKSAFTRSTVVAAMKFTISDQVSKSMIHRQHSRTDGQDFYVV